MVKWLQIVYLWFIVLVNGNLSQVTIKSFKNNCTNPFQIQSQSIDTTVTGVKIKGKIPIEIIGLPENNNGDILSLVRKYVEQTGVANGSLITAAYRVGEISAMHKHGMSILGFVANLKIRDEIVEASEKYNVEHCERPYEVGKQHPPNMVCFKPFQMEYFRFTPNELKSLTKSNELQCNGNKGILMEEHNGTNVHRRGSVAPIKVPVQNVHHTMNKTELTKQQETLSPSQIVLRLAPICINEFPLYRTVGDPPVPAIHPDQLEIVVDAIKKAGLFAIELVGIPERQGEDVHITVKKFADIMCISDVNHVTSAFRVEKTHFKPLSGPRRIIAVLNNSNDKSTMLIKTNACRISLNEFLSSKTKDLLHLAKKLSKTSSYMRWWIRDNQVKVAKRGEIPVNINSIDDLKELMHKEGLETERLLEEWKKTQ